MNIRFPAILAACAVCALASPSAGRSQGFYFNANAGGALADRVDLNGFFGPTPGVKLELHPGFRIGAAGGYNFNQYIGAELETGFIYNRVKGIVGGGNFDAALAHVPMMANVVFRCDRADCRWVPYFGAGAGGDVSQIGLRNVTMNAVTADGTDSTSVFAWQAFAGLRYRFSQNMSIGAGYKFFAARSAGWDFGGPADSIRTGEARIHSFLGEFNFKF